MSDPLNPRNPEGDLATFGASEKLILPVEEMPEETEEAPVTAAEEAPEETPEPSAEETPPAEEEPSILDIALKAEKPSEESEITRLRQENARMQGIIEGRLASLESQAKPAEPVEEEEDYLNTPAVQGLLRQLREENPEQYEPTLVRIAQKGMEEKIEKKLAALEQQRIADKQQQQNQIQSANALQDMRIVLAKIKTDGGIHAQIVEDMEARGPESFLWKKMEQTQLNKMLALSGEDGVRTLVSGVERELRERQPSVQSTAEPSTEASAGGGQPSTRGVQLGEKPDKKTPEDEIADEIMGIPRRTAAIDFL